MRRGERERGSKKKNMAFSRLGDEKKLS